MQMDELMDLEDISDTSDNEDDLVEFSQDEILDLPVENLSDIEESEVFDGIGNPCDELEKISDRIDESSIEKLTEMKEYLLAHRDYYDGVDESDDDQKVLKLR